MKSITENLQLSVLDLFSVLLPGAVMEGIFYQVPMVQKGLKEMLSFLQGEWQWGIAFVIGAYILGHTLFFMGSFLDDWVYDKMKDRNIALLNRAIALKKEKLGFDDDKVLNAYKWARAEFVIHYPSVFAIIENYEASSKFFRSLTVVLAIGCLIFGALLHIALAVICLIMSLLTMKVYIYLRDKAVHSAYEFILVIHTKQAI